MCFVFVAERTPAKALVFGVRPEPSTGWKGPQTPPAALLPRGAVPARPNPALQGSHLPVEGTSASETPRARHRGDTIAKTD